MSSTISSHNHKLETIVGSEAVGSRGLVAIWVVPAIDVVSASSLRIKMDDGAEESEDSGSDNGDDNSELRGERKLD